RMEERARAGRNQPPDDHVLLQTPELVLQTAHRRLGQHTGRLLEGSRRDERFGRQRRLRDAQQHRLEASRNLALLLDALVDVARPGAVELLAAQQRGVARMRDLNLAQHLTDDHLDALPIYLHALQAINVLNLAHQVVGQGLYALQAQDVVRVRLAVRNHLAALDLRAFENVQMAPLRNELLVLLAMFIGDDQAALALGLLAEAHRAGVLGQDGGILRLARLEQVGHTGQAAGDVARLEGLLRNTRDDIAYRNLGAVFETDDRARRQRVHCRDVGVCEGHFLTLGVHQAHDRPQILAAAAALFRIHHHRARQAGHLVHLALYGQAVDEVLELDEARHFRDDRMGVRIPGSHDLARLDRIAVSDRDHVALRHLVALPLTAELVHD